VTHIAIIGSGPSAIYAIQRLLACTHPLAITVFERSRNIGYGGPYDPAQTDAAMLANIASVELPPVLETLEEWLKACSRAELERLGVAPDGIDARAFVPRIAIGAYFAAQLRQLETLAAARGHALVLKRSSRVIDVAGGAQHVAISVAGRHGRIDRFNADHALLATGHGTAGDTGEALLEPAYPVRTLQEDETRIGILGSSLSAIDVAVAVALQCGSFEDDDRSFMLRPGRALIITMMSRRGLLPEADFYCPIPYEPLDIFTDSSIAAERAHGSEGLLDRVFALFARQLAALDPAFAAAIGLHEATVDDIATRILHERMESDPFTYARHNLAQMEASYRDRATSVWRYAILRMHEPFERVVPALTSRDRRRFDQGLKGLFIDNYAAVPHASIRRLLALHEAGVLSLLQLHEDYRIAPGPDGAGRELRSGPQTRCFDAVFDARGQAWQGAARLPFPTLRFQMLAQGKARTKAAIESAAMPVGHDLALPAVHGQTARLYTTAVPFMLRDRPFSQGLTAAADLGRTAAAAILSAVETQAAGQGASGEDTQALESLAAAIRDDDGLVFLNGDVVVLPPANA
jgi:uncharacterized NAD(P)/FAD-binding protein YdhS